MEKERLAREERLKRLEALRTAEEAVEQQEETTIPLPRPHLIEYHQFPWGTVERSVAEHERLLAEEARQVEEKVAAEEILRIREERVWTCREAREEVTLLRGELAVLCNIRTKIEQDHALVSDADKEVMNLEVDQEELGLNKRVQDMLVKSYSLEAELIYGLDARRAALFERKYAIGELKADAEERAKQLEELGTATPGVSLFKMRLSELKDTRSRDAEVEDIIIGGSEKDCHTGGGGAEGGSSTAFNAYPSEHLTVDMRLAEKNRQVAASREAKRVVDAASVTASAPQSGGGLARRMRERRMEIDEETQHYKATRLADAAEQRQRESESAAQRGRASAAGQAGGQ